MVNLTATVKCDSCNKGFVAIPTEKKGFMFFECPHCKKRYELGYISPKGIKIRTKLRQARERFRRMSNATPAEHQKQYELIEQLLKDFQKEFVPPSVA